ncbi:MAG: VOC family protein [Myxococcota bacterium]
MKPRISIVTLGVSDLSRSASFYRDGLGLPVREESSEMAFFDMAGMILALFPREILAVDAGVPAHGSGFSGFTLAHNVNSPEAVDAVMNEAEAAGAEIVKAAAETSWGGYSGYFADLDGFLWEVAWAPVMPDLAAH